MRGGTYQSTSIHTPGLHIYGWTLGFDLTPADIARKFGHADVVELILSSQSPTARFIDALWCGDGDCARRELARYPGIARELESEDHSLLPAAAWWYRPESVRLMLEMGLNPHATGVHRSTALDPNRPLTQQNEFGGIPLEACSTRRLAPDDVWRSVSIAELSAIHRSTQLVHIGSHSAGCVSALASPHAPHFGS